LVSSYCTTILWNDIVAASVGYIKKLSFIATQIQAYELHRAHDVNVGCALSINTSLIGYLLLLTVCLWYENSSLW
jgi:hypothetical protein